MSEEKRDEIKPQLESRRETSIEQGNYNERIEGNYYEIQGNLIQNTESEKSPNTPSNLNRQGSGNFVGREDELEKLHQLLQQNERVSISAIAGMGGIGDRRISSTICDRLSR